LPPAHHLPRSRSAYVRRLFYPKEAHGHL
jgi:hypothetical protein